MCLQGLFSSPEKYLATLLNCSGTRILDCGVETRGTAELGVIMADAAMGGRRVDVLPERGREEAARGVKEGRGAKGEEEGGGVPLGWHKAEGAHRGIG